MEHLDPPDWMDDCPPPVDDDQPVEVAPPASTAKVAGFNCTDMGNALRMVATHGENIRYVVGIGWLVWRKSHWQRDTTNAVQEVAKATAAKMRADAERMAAHAVTKDDKDAAKALVAWAATTESVTRIRGMIALAESDPRVSKDVDELDADPYMFNVANGTIDLRTGKLRKHERSDLITVCAPASLEDWSRTVTDSTWHRFLERIQPNPDTRLYLQKLAGLSLIGEQREHVIPFLYGGGQNGKGTMLRAFGATFGKFACTVPVDMLIERTTTPHASQRATLMGKRIAIVDELPQNREFDTAALKSLSGGDRIPAQYMRQDWFDFKPSHTLWLQGNDKPRLPGSDFGVWRRMRLIPFLEKIPDDEKDPELDAKLAAERDIILRWAIDGAVAYMREGLGVAAEVTDATEEYRADSDILGQMLRDCCTVAEGEWVSKQSFRNVLEKWFESEGRKGIPSNGTIKTDFAKRGIVECRRYRLEPWGWSGISVNTAWAEFQTKQAPKWRD